MPIDILIDAADGSDWTGRTFMHELDGQVGIVTGGGRGIGRAIAEALARDGAAVCVAARSADEVAETVKTVAAAGRARARPPHRRSG